MTNQTEEFQNPDSHVVIVSVHHNISMKAEYDCLTAFQILK